MSDQQKTKNIRDLAYELGLGDEDFDLYGRDKAKLSLSLKERDKKGKYVLLTSLNPTPFGEGKTTMNIALSMALNEIGKVAISTLREPSLGPCFGMKGGATGGGKVQLYPADDINLHFTGDFHAITSAHNLLAALLDNHIYHGNDLNIDLNRIYFNRVLDVNDRSLRRINLSHRQSSFSITAASEIMAIVALSEDCEDLRRRLSNILVAHSKTGEEILAKDLNAVGSMMALLKNALRPNLVQTSSGTPAIVHAGPFANIAHGCNSVIASKTALSLSEYVITEAGFGSDLGAEKFFNIKCRQSGLQADAVVLVTTIQALRYHGDCKGEELDTEKFECIYKGLEHLRKHIYNLMMFGIPVIIAVNVFENDDEKALAILDAFANEVHVPISFVTAYHEGAEGAIDLAYKVMEACEKPSNFRLLYENEGDLKKSILKIAQNIYGAKAVNYSKVALEKLNSIPNQNLPVCMAKTQYSLSDNPELRNVPKDFELTVKDVLYQKGAEFVVVYLASILTMPGLSQHPNAFDIDILQNGEVVGLR